MNKQEFINRLENAVKTLSDDEMRSTIEFYSEAIDDRMEDGMTEEDAVADLGISPENIAETMDAHANDGISNEKMLPCISIGRSSKCDVKTDRKSYGCLAMFIVAPIISIVFLVVITIVLFTLIGILFPFQ